MDFLQWVGPHGYMDQIVSGLATWAIGLTFAACLAILTKGADLMIAGAASLARLTALPEIIIGATIISLGTTLPEVFVSVLSAWTGHPGLALGNGVGSVICNTGLILGFTCIVAATAVAFGTSLPELATAVIAIRRGHPQIMVGNVIGADILSCLFVVGASAAATPLQVTPNFFRFHFPAMLLILYSFRLFVSVNKDGRFKRLQGVWIFGIYVVYLTLQYKFNFSG